MSTHNQELFKNWVNENRFPTSAGKWMVISGVYPMTDNIEYSFDELKEIYYSSTEFKDDIDTIGKCANCGVEFHIHKPSTTTDNE